MKTHPFPPDNSLTLSNKPRGLFSSTAGARKTSVRFLLKPAIVALFALLSCGTSAFGTTWYWDANGAVAGSGSAPSGTWGSDAFWNTDSTGAFASSVETNTTSADSLVFSVAPGASSGNGAYTITVSGTQAAQGLTLQSSGSMAINSGTIYLDAGGITAPQFAFGSTVHGLISINSAIVMTADQTWTNGSTSNAITVNGVISGAQNLTKSGNGTLILAGANLYTGNTTVSTGTLAIGNGASGNLASSGTVTVNGGAALSLNLANGDTFANNIVNNGSISRVQANTNTLSGNISGTGSLTQNNASGITVLSGSNIYSGATTVTNGVLRAVANAGNLSSGTSSAALSLSSTMSLATNSTLQLRSDSNTTFTSAGITYTGTVNIDVNNVAAVTSSGPQGNKLTLLGTNGFSTNNGTINVTGGNGYGLQLGYIIASSGATFNVASGVNLSMATVETSNVNGSVVNFQGAGNTTVGFLTASTAANRSLIANFNQSGTVALTGANNLNKNFAASSVIGINNGTLLLNNSAALNFSGLAPALNLGNSTASSNNATILLGGTDAAGVNGGISVTGTGHNIFVEDTDTGTLTVGGQNTSGINSYSGNIQLGVTTNTAKDLTIVAATGGEMDFTGQLQKNGTSVANLTVGNATFQGKVKLTGSNSYLGTTTVNGGLLLINGNNSTATGAVQVNGGAGLGGTGTVGGAVTLASGTSAATQGNINLQDGAINTLTLANGITVGGTTAGNTSGLLFDLGSTTANTDRIAITGGTVLVNTGGGVISIAALGSSLGIGDYNLMTSTVGGLGSNFTLANTSVVISGTTYNLSLANSTSTVEKLTVTLGTSSATSTSYTLTMATANLNVLVGHSISVTSSIANTGTGSADTLNYSGLGGSVTGGTLSGGTTNGTNIAQGQSGSNSGQTYNAGPTSGTYVINPVVTSATNSTIGGNATATGTTGITVHVYDAASLSASQSGSNILASNLSGSFRASAKITSDGGLSNNQGFVNVNVNGQQIDAGNSTTVATFDSTGRLNGNYTATKTLGFDHVTSSGSAIIGGTGATATLTLTATVSGQTAGAGQVLGAPVFSGQKYGTTTAGGSSSGYGITSNISSDPHSPTTATIINGTASANTTVLMSFDKVPAGGEPDNAFRVSDILTLSGLVKTGGTGHDGSTLTDIYVLQLSYDSTATGQKYLGWYDATQNQWVNAVAGNSAGGPYDGTGEYVGSYASYLATLSPTDQVNLAAQLGAFGYDASTHTAWAVVDHESEFAVIPEPGTWGMIIGGFGMLIGIQRLRKHRVGT